MFEPQRARLKALAKIGKQLAVSGHRLLESQQKLSQALKKLAPIREALNHDLARWQKRTAPQLARVQKIVTKLQK